MLNDARAQRWLRRAFFVAAAFAFVMAILPGVPDIPGKEGDKVQHVLAFFTLGALSAAGWRSTTAIMLFGALATFGGLIEIVQSLPALHADAQWSDWFADMAASLVAISATRVLLSRS